MSSLPGDFCPLPNPLHKHCLENPLLTDLHRHVKLLVNSRWEWYLLVAGSKSAFLFGGLYRTMHSVWKPHMELNTSACFLWQIRVHDRKGNLAPWGWKWTVSRGYCIPSSNRDSMKGSKNRKRIRELQKVGHGEGWPTVTKREKEQAWRRMSPGSYGGTSHLGP